MASSRITAQALDVILKLEAEQLSTAFPRYFDLDIPPIVRPFPTEIPQLDLHVDRLDTVFELADDTLLHLECQSEHRSDTLPRFLANDVALYRKHRRRIRTVVIYGPAVRSAPSVLDIIAVRYTVQSVFLGQRDGEEAYRRLAERLMQGKPFDERDRLDLVFLPLMGNQHPLEDVVARGLSLARTLPDGQEQPATGALLALAYHYIGQNAFERLMERLMATNYDILDKYLTRYVEQRLNQRLEQGLQQGTVQARRDDVLKVLASRFQPLPVALTNRIAAIQDQSQLDALFDLSLSAPTLEVISQALDGSQPQRHHAT